MALPVPHFRRLSELIYHLRVTPERWQRVKQLFEAALEQEPISREKFLAGAAADDPTLAEEVKRLLASDEKAGAFLSAPPEIRAFASSDHDGLHSEPTVRQTDAAPPLVLGSLADRYLIEREIGRGAMGRVFAARDLKLGRDVAIKVLPAGTRTADQLSRFEQEARAAGSLDHPNVLVVHDIGMVEGEPFIVSELLQGATLRERLAGKELPPAEVVDYALQLAQGLHAAHEKGIVHRDLKPENLFVTREGRLKILDFGIAKLLEPPGRAGPHTAEGAVIGTVDYMSPEQVRGEPADGRSDIFACGSIVYEMLTGRRAFEGATDLETASAILESESPPLPADLAALDRIVWRCLEKNPAHRFQSAADLGVALTAALASGPARSLRRRLVLALAATVIVAPLTWWAYQRSPFTSTAPRHLESLAVLPLENLSRDSSQDYFVDGMTEALIADLSKIRALRVVSRRSVMRYKAVPKPLPEIARELHVDAIVEGSVMHVGDRVRVIVELIDAASDRHLWGETYDRRLQDVLGLQSELARAVAREVRVAVTADEQARLPVARPVNVRAHDAYLLGRYFWNQRTREGLGKAFERFDQAIKEDPKYAAAQAGLADYYNILPFYSRISPREVFPQAKAAAEKALALDDGLAEAHASLAYIKAYYDWDWAGAEREFQRALELNPSYAAAHHSYSRLLAAMNRIEDALAEIQRAEEVEPMSTLLKANTAMILFFAHRYDEAIQRLKETLELDSNFAVAHWGLGLAYEQKGMYGAAIDALEKVASLSRRDANILSSLGHVYAIAGRRAEATQLIDELRKQSQQAYVSSYFFAVIHAGLGERERALETLSQAAEERSTLLVYLRIDPRFSNLHSDPRFQALLHRVGFQSD
jgi:serine/threonine-protein kinase